MTRATLPGAPPAAWRAALGVALLLALAAPAARAQTVRVGHTGPLLHMTREGLLRVRGIQNPLAHSESEEGEEGGENHRIGSDTNDDPMWHRAAVTPPSPPNDPVPAALRATTSFSYRSRMALNFNAINETPNTYPADCNLAVGPNHVVAMVNRTVEMFSKDSTVAQAATGLDAFFGQPTGGGWYGSFDPKVVYDPGSGRFFATALNFNPSGLQTHFDLAISVSSDPTQGWYLTNITNLVDSLAIDYPEIGFGPGAVYLTGNPRDGKSLTGWPLVKKTHSSSIYVIDKAALIAGQSATYYEFDDTPGANGSLLGTFKTALCYGTPPAGVDAFLVAFLGIANSMQREHVFAVTLPGNWPNSSPTISFQYVDTDDPGGPPNAAQQGGSALIDDSRLGAVPLCATYRNGEVVTCTQGANGSYTKVRVLEFGVSGWPTLTLAHQIDYLTGQAYSYWPAVTINDPGDLGLVFSRSSTTEYVSGLWTERMEDETFLDNSLYLKQGQAYYSPAFETSPHRWGDYAGAAVDPVTQGIWFFNMFADNSGAYWSTQIGYVPHAVFVDPTNVGSQRGSRTYPYQSLVFALAAAIPGNDLVIRADTYPGSYTLTKPLTVIADGGTVQFGP